MSLLNAILKILTAAWYVLREARDVISGFSHLIKETKRPLSVVEYAQPDSMKVKKMDKRELQLDMEKLFHKNQTFPRIMEEFVAIPEFAQTFKDNGIPEDFGYALLIQMALHKRCNISTMVGLMRKHFIKEENHLQKTADMLLKACQADLVDWSVPLSMFIVRWDITDDVQHDLDRYQYPLPMVMEPLPIKTNHDTGYLSSRNSVILRNNHHDDDVCLGHLNRMNRIKLSINFEVATLIKNKWRYLDKAKPGESRKDYQARVKAFDKYDRTAKDVMDALTFADNEFYLTHKYDKRGRVYCQGYHVNYAGNSWNKAVIELANKEVTR